MSKPKNAAGAQSPMLAAALAYAQWGWHVFPVPPGTKKSYKSKRFSNGRRWGATTDAAEIRRNWRQWPKANVGVATGADSGIIVMDIDTDEGHGVDGLASLAALEKEHGALPPTLQARTPSGGSHYFFKHPGNGTKIKGSTSEVDPGIDIRADGNMVVAPPSIKGDGAYAWSNDQRIADPPQWLLNLVVKNPQKKSQKKSRPRNARVSDEQLEAAVAIIPNDDLDWESWNRIGMAIWAATQGRDVGRDLFHLFSRKSAKYNAENVDEKWKQITSTPPDQIGAGTLFYLADQAKPGWRDKFKRVHTLEIGSDVDIAHRVRQDLIRQFGDVVYAEGAFWRYRETRWDAIRDHELRLIIHSYDGATYYTLKGQSVIRLGKGRIDSVINECAALCADPLFFDEHPIGINCASGFIRFASDGSPKLKPHDPAHRCRHTLPGRWQVGANATPPGASLLHKLLEGIFRGDHDASEKVNLLSEICGVAALGYATKLRQPRAVVLWGKSAENGKSQILDLTRGLVSATAICSVPPGKMGDERHIIGLVAKLLNATDELSSAQAISTEKFKSVVTGEPIDGRDVYTTRVEFRSMAQNIHATNTLPPFQGGMDRGVQRRLLLLVFNRVIPMNERIENIGQRIAAEEPDLLLAWAVAGASRIVKNRNFTIPQSCKLALTEWMFQSDAVLAWAHQCVEVEPEKEDGSEPCRIRTRDAYNEFREWAKGEQYKEDRLPGQNGFTQRVTANVAGVETKRTEDGRWFLRMVIKAGGKTEDGSPPPQGDLYDDVPF